MYLEISQNHFSSDEARPKWEKQIVRWERRTENQSKSMSGKMSKICDFSLWVCRKSLVEPGAALSSFGHQQETSAVEPSLLFTKHLDLPDSR